MFYIPSARRFILPALVVLIVLILTHLFIQYEHQPSWSRTNLWQAALQRYVTRGVHILPGRNQTRSEDVFGAYDYSGGHIQPDSEQALWAAVYNELTFSDVSLAQQTLSQTHHQEQEVFFPAAHPRLKPFLTCDSNAVNTYTSHLRLSAKIHNINLTLALSSTSHDPNSRFFNPAIIPLPHWSTSGGTTASAKYVLVSRLVTTGFHQESHICLADICLPDHHLNQRSPAASTSNTSSPKPASKILPPDTRPCTAQDSSILGAHGGMRCITEPVKINIPSTPAEHCDAAWLAFPDIPGFHDPRVFWSGKGEPLILVNSASRYGCVGLWVVDLRRVFPDLAAVLKPRRQGRGGRDGDHHRAGQNLHDGVSGSAGTMLMSYPHLTEITRNPRSSRALVEKNWVMWFPNHEEAYVQYDMMGSNTPREEISMNQTLGKRTWAQTHNDTIIEPNADGKGKHRGGRTFAKLTGNGFTTRNLTSPHEQACFTDAHGRDKLGNRGHWHQGSNALRLLLCTRAEARRGQCDEEDAVDDGRSLHFAVVHRKFSNAIDLPLRYERYMLLWESRKPFKMLGVSRFPLLMREEWARPWSVAENWPAAAPERTLHNENEKKWGNWTLQDDVGRKVRSEGRGPGHGAGSGSGAEETDGRRTDYLSDGDNNQASYFTYTPSLTWAWKPQSAGLGEDDEDDVEYMSRLGMGYLGDEVIVGIGMDDVQQGFAKVKVEDLLQCLRLCPGVEIAEEGKI
ncbi:hypothetical protein LTR84_002952 [Exophiala bonariae]|uniref:Uncharacterized protein n=1 Tax=Exophiala bonariae TaxID=1690606 RepID=A0AAV9NCU1_9EURO|nr:hypothetical protein LTR84_002952 [Exophiala bonariae]